MEKIRLAMPDVKMIWEHSSFMRAGLGGGDIEGILVAERDCQRGLEGGEFTMDSEFCQD